MAKRKETIWQRDFALGSIREEAVERDDTALIERSLRECKNTITLTTGQLETRPGTIQLSTVSGETEFEVDLGGAGVFDLIINSDGLTVFSGDDTVEHQIVGMNWAALSGAYGSPAFADINFWAIPDPDRSQVIIGSQYFPMQSLALSAGTWTLAEYQFSSLPSGAKNISFYQHRRDVEIRPSALSGTITVEADAAVWSDGHANTYIRYVDRQIKLTTRVSDTVMNAEVVEELPPTKDITVVSVSGFQVGDAVEAAVSGGQGVVTGIAGSVITVLVTKNFSGFASSEDLIGPNAKSNMSSVVDAAAPAFTFLWDMQLWNAVNGYAGTAAGHVGRMFLGNFPSTPNVFAASAAQDISDFSMGVNDGDGFVEAIAPNAGGQLKHIISAEDLLFFTSSGLLFQRTRDGSAITPTNIAPVRFSKFGCSDIAPVTVDDAAVFVDRTGKQILAAALAGDIYQSWRIEHISQYAPHLIETPKKLGATSTGSERPEMFVYVVNEEGTVSVCQWQRADNVISWRPWDTDGSFLSIQQVSGKIHAIVDRTINGSQVRFRERFEYDAYLDCMAALRVDAGNPTGVAGQSYLGTLTKAATHLQGHECSVYFEGFDMGDADISAAGFPLDADGNVLSYPSGNEGFVQIGLSFDLSIIPWARRSVATQRGTRQVKRLISIFVTVQSTGVFEIQGRSFGGYRVGEDLTKPPPLRDTQVKMVLLGAASFERIPITRSRPGPFRLLILGYRVTV